MCISVLLCAVLWCNGCGVPVRSVGAEGVRRIYPEVYTPKVVGMLWSLLAQVSPSVTLQTHRQLDRQAHRHTGTQTQRHTDN